MKKIYLIIISVFLFQNINAQDTITHNINEKKLWGGFDFGHGFSLSDGDGYEIMSDDAFWLWCLRAKAGYYVTPRISLGLGVGLTGSAEIPLFFDFRYLLAKQWYAYEDIGGTIRLRRTLKVKGFSESETTVQKGFMSEVGFGYKLRFGRRFAFNFSTGYNLMSYLSESLSDSSLEKSSHWRHSLVFRLGFEI